MAVNKVEYGSSVLIDLTSDTISPDVLKDGIIAHDKSGTVITGTAKCFPLEPYVYDNNIGYVDNGVWKYENPTKTYIDIYEVESGGIYIICLGNVVGSRFRCMFTTTNIIGETSNVTGTMIINKNNPNPHDRATYICPDDGYILVAKDNVGKSGLKSYVIDLSSTCI